MCTGFAGAAAYLCALDSQVIVSLFVKEYRDTTNSIFSLTISSSVVGSVWG